MYTFYLYLYIVSGIVSNFDFYSGTVSSLLSLLIVDSIPLSFNSTSLCYILCYNYTKCSDIVIMSSDKFEINYSVT